jgi:hypothetical protein
LSWSAGFMQMSGEHTSDVNPKIASHNNYDDDHTDNVKYIHCLMPSQTGGDTSYEVSFTSSQYPAKLARGATSRSLLSLAMRRGRRVALGRCTSREGRTNNATLPETSARRWSKLLILPSAGLLQCLWADRRQPFREGVKMKIAAAITVALGHELIKGFPTGIRL